MILFQTPQNKNLTNKAKVHYLQEEEELKHKDQQKKRAQKQQYKMKKICKLLKLIIIQLMILKSI